MAKTKLIPGFRFHPTDVEILQYFLKRKVMGRKFLFDVIAEVDIYKYSPWDLPDKSCLRTGDLEWYFFCPREKKYASGARMNRATEAGYWKTTGKDRPVHHKNQIVGLIKTLVFHTGKAPKGERTDWVMHEFRLESNDLTDKGIPQDSYVLCKVFHKDGPGPRNGAQYGKPFNEEDWDDDGEIECVDSIPLVACSALPTPPITHLSSVAADTHPPVGGSIGSLDSCVSGLVVPSSDDKVMPNDGDDIDAMLRAFTEDDINPIEKTDDCGKEKVEAAPLDVNDIFKDLGDIDKCIGWGDGRDFCSGQLAAEYNMTDPNYLELLDLGPFDLQK